MPLLVVVLVVGEVVVWAVAANDNPAKAKAKVAIFNVLFMI